MTGHRTSSPNFFTDLEPLAAGRNPQALTAAERLRLLQLIEAARAELLNQLNQLETPQRLARKAQAYAADAAADESWLETQ